jgi:EAL domain-containing protein (putative c-di-GMP-specific phosphodiesterase class I)
VAHGCGVLQGYLFGKPVAMEEFERVWGGAM